MSLLESMIDTLEAVADYPSENNRATARELAQELNLLRSAMRAGVDWASGPDQTAITSVPHPSIRFEIEGDELVATDPLGNKDRRPIPEGVLADWLPELSAELAARFNLAVDYVAKRLGDFAEQHGRHVPQFVRKDRPPCKELHFETDPIRGVIKVTCGDTLHDYQIDPREHLDAVEIARALAAVHQWDPRELAEKLGGLTMPGTSFSLTRKGG